jgi:hypothetical protein
MPLVKKMLIGVSTASHLWMAEDKGRAPTRTLSAQHDPPRGSDQAVRNGTGSTRWHAKISKSLRLTFTVNNFFANCCGPNTPNDMCVQFIAQSMR